MQKEIEWLLKEKYKGKMTEAAKKDVERLKAGEPLDYVIGFTEFGVPPGSCKIDLSKKPLIPRPETEYWVQKAITEIYRDFQSFENHGMHVLDVFSGSGCIGMAVLKYIKNSHVVFAEKDRKFVEQIKINIRLNKKSFSNSRELENDKKVKRYHVAQSDVFSNVKGRFDVIFANPPYIATARKNKLQPSVLTYEPKMALFGGKDGLFYIRKFLAEAKNFLTQEGKIYMEFDSIQKKPIEKLLKKYKYKTWEFNKDQYGRLRWIVIEK